MKKGQVTVFIVIGIIILAAMAFFFFLREEFITGDLKVQDNLIELDALQFFVTDCLEEATIDAIYEVLNNGGYYELPTNEEIFNQLTEEEQFELPYYFIDEESNLPSIETIQEEVAKAAESHFLSCINNFESFEKQGYIIEAAVPEFIVMFSQDSTLSYLTYPLDVELDNKVSQISRFSGEVDLNFLDKYNVLENYFSEQEDNPDYFLVGSLASMVMSNENTFWFDQYNDHGSDVILTLNYDEQLRDEPLLYNFAVNYDWSKLDESVENFEVDENDVNEGDDEEESADNPEDLENVLYLSDLEEWNIVEEGLWTYQIVASGENLTYSLDNDIPSINSATGLITLNTNNFPNDEYWYFVKVTDGNNRSTTGTLYININVIDVKRPVIENIEKQTAIVGEEFNLNITVIDESQEGLLYSDMSNLFDVNTLTGEIRFTPEEDDLGIHSVRVDAHNYYGNYWQRFELEVVR